MVKCEICGKELKIISYLHLRSHKISFSEYKELYPNSHTHGIEISTMCADRNTKFLTGRKCPWLVERNLNNNPMWDRETVEKHITSYKEGMENGRIDAKRLLAPFNLPSDHEKKVIGILEELSISLKYVGDGSFLVGTKIPDFINEEMKIAVELNINNNRKNNRYVKNYEREKYFLERGWRLIIVRSSDKEHIKEWLLPFFSGGVKAYKVQSVNKIALSPKKFVYNIETTPNNNYFANNILVHNCSYSCAFCFSYFQKSSNPAIKNKDLKAININRMIKELDGTIDSLFYRHFYKRKFVLHWGGLADPFCNFELLHFSGLPLVEKLGELNYPTIFSTKGAAIVHPNYLKVWDKCADQKNFAFQVSMVTADDDLSRQVEVDVPPPSFRFKVMKEMSDRGYWTILRLRPFIIGITDPSLDEMLDKALKAGINAISTEFFAIDNRCNVGMRTRYDSLAKLIGVDDLQKYFAALSPSERGGYMRLNRHIKEPFIKKMYKFCIEHGLTFACSDPDFKELNFSGSCCGLTDHFPANPLLENWTKNQMTYHLKELRKLYHTTGECGELRFDEVYRGESYLEDHRLAQDHPTVIGRCTAERMLLTPRIIVQEQWNNSNSPANPRNYFHGILMPCGKDEFGNLKFKYNPQEYEAEWVSEGINLKI